MIYRSNKQKRMTLAINKSDYNINRNSINFGNLTYEVHHRVDGGVCLKGLQTKEMKLQKIKACPCTFGLVQGYVPCDICPILCYAYFQAEHFCCDGDYCCCYSEPGACNRNENCPLQCCPPVPPS